MLKRFIVLFTEKYVLVKNERNYGKSHKRYTFFFRNSNNAQSHKEFIMFLVETKTEYGDITLHYKVR